jgi:hypothetical protein
MSIERDVQQSLAITRAIFFYRLDPAHQFQRHHHNITRWNLALFTALLSLPDKSSANPTHMPPADKRFMTSYLAGVMEHHNTPQTFTAREAIHQALEERGVGCVHDIWSESEEVTQEGCEIFECGVGEGVGRCEEEHQERRV